MRLKSKLLTLSSACAAALTLAACQTMPAPAPLELSMAPCTPPPVDMCTRGEPCGALVTEQAPQHAGPVRRLGRGWDNEVFLVGQAHVARLPRRAPGVPLLRNEHRWLGELPPLPIPIPSLVHRGQPSERFRHPWSLCRFHPGERVDDRPLDRSAAVAMGSFLAALHHPAPPT